MPLTKVSFSVIQVANNVTSTTVGNTTSIPSFTFDQNGVITSASNTAISGAGITANTVANSAFQTGSVENYLNARSLNLGMRNRIINGDMRINQRGVTSGITTGYFVDRWTLSGCSTSATLSSSLPTGFANGISITATSGNPIAIQKIEAKNCSDLSGRNVTLSFYAKNISNATILYASLGYPTSTPDDFNATTTISEQNLGTLTSDWVRYTYTWTNLPSGAVNGLGLNLLCAGTGTFSMGITGVQLEVGNAPTPFEFRQHGTELALCQRYYYKRQFTGGSRSISMLQAYSTSGAYGKLFDLPVTMRATPTCSLNSYSYFSFSNATSNAVAASAGGLTDTTADYVGTGSMTGSTGLVAGNASNFISISALGYIDASAEL